MAAPPPAAPFPPVLPNGNPLLSPAVLVQPTAVTPPIDMQLHNENCVRLVSFMVSEAAACAAATSHVHTLGNGVILVAGSPSVTRDDTDHEPLFRQESNFHWMFGVKEPDFVGVVELDTGRRILFCPDLPPEYAIVMGPIKTPAQWMALYQVDDVQLITALPAYMATRAPAVIHRLAGYNTDGKKTFVPATFATDGTNPGISAYALDDDLLAPCIARLRAIKSARELMLLQYICRVSSEAHLAVMQQNRNNPYMTEFQAESLFKHWCHYFGKARYMSYTCICASGAHGAVLHYGHAGEPNASMIDSAAGVLCLFDMGAEYHCYGSDITTTYPANGTFTADQKMIYNAVLAAQLAVMGAMAPGVEWLDMQTLAYRTLLTELTAGGLLTGDIDDMMAVNLGGIFMPHGLGHMLGIDTHDPAGYLLPHTHALPTGVDMPTYAASLRDTRRGYSSLRTKRPLVENMYITVEPGCYFIDPLLDEALANPDMSVFIVPEVLARFRGFGGVRIEDDVVVTADGCLNFTHAPRTVEDIEAVMAGTITQRAQLTQFHGV